MSSPRREREKASSSLWYLLTGCSVSVTYLLSKECFWSSFPFCPQWWHLFPSMPVVIADLCPVALNPCPSHGPPGLVPARTY